MKKLKSHIYPTNDIKNVEQEIQLLHVWLKDISFFAGWSELSLSLAALRAVLQELRDHLPLSTLAQLSAQLPIIIRGILFEGWRPSEAPKSYV